MTGSRPSHPVLLGIDVGGTFTDAVLVAGGGLYRAKVPTTPDQSDGVLAAAERVLAGAGVAPAAVAYFAHGMTTATNALLERKGVRTASVSTRGFRDILEIGRQNRPRLYDLCPQRPEPLIPRGMRSVAAGRITPGGEEEPLPAEEAERVAAEVAAMKPRSVAVCLLFSFRDPSHEQLLAEKLRQAMPGVHVSLSSRVLPQFREYERFSTTAVDAYLTPVVERYLRALGVKAVANGLPLPAIMQSSGGVLPLAEARASAAPLLLSGPAAGVVGAIFAGGRGGIKDLIAFDMGGTSTDVSLVRGGFARTTAGTEVGGCPVALPMIDIHTIGAGGGSIAWTDAGGALRVGPQSAGAMPGPACYGHGGAAATVTDANLCLGYLGGSLGGTAGMALGRGAAEAAIDRLAAPLGMCREEAAMGIRRVANAEMVRALRVISVQRGHDPRRFALLAFGGAGPMHAADLAEELDMTRVMVPDSCGVLSALGMVVGDQRRDWVRTVLAMCGWDEKLLEEAWAELESVAAEGMAEPHFARYADLRYAGQSHELTVSAGRPARREELVSAFTREHQKVYGYHAEDEDVELVNIRLIASVPREKPAVTPVVAAGREPARRQAFFSGAWREIEVWRRVDMGARRLEGPVVVEEEEATTVVPPGWRARLDEAGNLWLERGRDSLNVPAGTEDGQDG